MTVEQKWCNPKTIHQLTKPDISHNTKNICEHIGKFIGLERLSAAKGGNILNYRIIYICLAIDAANLNSSRTNKLSFSENVEKKDWTLSSLRIEQSINLLAILNIILIPFFIREDGETITKLKLKKKLKQTNWITWQSLSNIINILLIGLSGDINPFYNVYELKELFIQSVQNIGVNSMKDNDNNNNNNNNKEKKSVKHFLMKIPTVTSIIELITEYYFDGNPNLYSTLKFEFYLTFLKKDIQRSATSFETSQSCYSVISERLDMLRLKTLFEKIPLNNEGFFDSKGCHTIHASFLKMNDINYKDVIILYLVN